MWQIIQKQTMYTFTEKLSNDRTRSGWKPILPLKQLLSFRQSEYEVKCDQMMKFISHLLGNNNFLQNWYNHNEMYLRILNYVKFNFKSLCFVFYLVMKLAAGYDGENLNGENSTMTDAIKVTCHVIQTFQCNFLSIVRFYCSKKQLPVLTDDICLGIYW